MEKPFAAIGLIFFLFALVTLALIFRDVFCHLNIADQTTFRRWLGRKLSLKTRAVNSVWSEHARLFPKSAKRRLFVFFSGRVRGDRCWIATLARSRDAIAVRKPEMFLLEPKWTVSAFTRTWRRLYGLTLRKKALVMLSWSG